MFQNYENGAYVLALPSFHNFPIRNMYLPYQPYPQKKCSAFSYLSAAPENDRISILCCGPAEATTPLLNDWLLLSRRSRNTSKHQLKPTLAPRLASCCIKYKLEHGCFSILSYFIIPTKTADEQPSWIWRRNQNFTRVSNVCFVCSDRKIYETHICYCCLQTT